MHVTVFFLRDSNILVQTILPWQISFFITNTTEIETKIVALTLAKVKFGFTIFAKMLGFQIFLENFDEKFHFR